MRDVEIAPEIADEVDDLRERLSPLTETNPKPSAILDVQEACRRTLKLTDAHPVVGHHLRDDLLDILQAELNRSSTMVESMFALQSTSHQIQQDILATLNLLDPLELCQITIKQRGKLDPLIEVTQTTVHQAQRQKIRQPAVKLLTNILLYTSKSLTDIESFEPELTAQYVSDLLTPIDYVANERQAIVFLYLLAEEIPSALEDVPIEQILKSIADGPPTFQFWGMLLHETPAVNAEATDASGFMIKQVCEELVDLVDQERVFSHPIDEWEDAAIALGRGLLVSDHDALYDAVDTIDDRIRFLTDELGLTDAELPDFDRQRLAQVRGTIAALALEPVPDESVKEILRICGRPLRRLPTQSGKLAWILGLGASAKDRDEAFERIQRTVRTSTLEEHGGRQIGAQVLGQHAAARPAAIENKIPSRLLHRIQTDSTSTWFSLPAQAVGDIIVFGDGELVTAVETLSLYTRRSVAPELLEQRPAAIELGIMIAFTVEDITRVVDESLAPAVAILRSDIREQVNDQPGRIPTTPAQTLGLLVAYDTGNSEEMITELRERAAFGGPGDGAHGYRGSQEEAVGFAAAYLTDAMSKNEGLHNNITSAESAREARMSAQALGTIITYGDGDSVNAFDHLSDELIPDVSVLSPGTSQYPEHAYLLGRLVAEEPKVADSDPPTVLRRIIKQYVDPSDVPYARHLMTKAFGTAVAASVWTDQSDFVAALDKWRQSGERVEYRSSASLPVGLVSIYDENVFQVGPSARLSTAINSNDVVHWRDPATVTAIGELVMDSYTASSVEEAVIDYFGNQWGSNDSIDRANACVFHELVDKNIVSPAQVVDLLKQVIPTPITQAIDEDPETFQWLFRSISSAAASGEISDRTLVEVIVNALTSRMVEIDIKLDAMEALIEIGNQYWRHPNRTRE